MSERVAVPSAEELHHIVTVPSRREGEPGFNNQVDVFSGKNASIYRGNALLNLLEDPIVREAFRAFGVIGDEQSESWAQLIEHIAGSAAAGVAIAEAMAEHGANVDIAAVRAALLYHDAAKPLEIQAARAKRAAAAAEGKDAGSVAGLANAEGAQVTNIWEYLRQAGVSELVITAAQNTGRGDRYYSDLRDYPEGKARETARRQWQQLADATGLSFLAVEAMTPTERRRLSIEQKGTVAAIAGLADALSSGPCFAGVRAINEMRDAYLAKKTDPESQLFFGQDWPEYYKLVVDYLIDQVPADRRAAFAQRLAEIDDRDVYYRVIMPRALGHASMARAVRMHFGGSECLIDGYSYDAPGSGARV